jgi:hypothetical protein
MPDDQFFLTVEAMFPDKSQRLALLCRTGSRSVRGGNILSAPEEFLGPEYAGRGYSRVFNIWQGFVGQPMAPIKGSSVVGPTNTVTAVTLDGGATAFGFAPYQLDLNNDGLVNIEATTAGVTSAALQHPYAPKHQTTTRCPTTAYLNRPGGLAGAAARAFSGGTGSGGVQCPVVAGGGSPRELPVTPTERPDTRRPGGGQGSEGDGCTAPVG